MTKQAVVSAPDLSRLRIEEGSRSGGKPGRRMAKISAALGIVVLSGGLAVGILKNRDPVVEVAVAQPAEGDLRAGAVLTASGYVTPRRRATVAAKITGRVTAVRAEEGMHAREGQVLATLDASDAQVRLESARSDREATQATIADLEVRSANAERELNRAHKLESQGIATSQALDLARTNAESLRAQLAMARKQVKAADARIAVAQQDLDNTVIRAPFTGMVVSKDAQVGEIVSPVSAGGGFTRTGIATLVDMNSLEIEVDVNESYIARVLPGQPTIATLDAYPDWPIPSRVRTVIPTADRQKATVKVRISFNQLDQRILPDMGVKVAFLSDGKEATGRRETTTVPEAAVRKAEGKQFVFLVKEGRIDRRAIDATVPRNGSVEVLAGVAAGDRVVVSGPPELREGQRVEVKR